MLYYTKFYIEWTAAETPIETAAELVELQVALARWERRWANDYLDLSLRKALVEFAHEWSDRVLKMSGLLEAESL